jgi:hypothetical protein
MRTIPTILAVGLTLAVQAGPAKALVLLDTGLDTSTVALRADTYEHFTCDDHGCDQDYDVATEQASQITLAQGGVATAFTFAASVPNGLAFISLFRASGSGKLVTDAAHLVWTGSVGGGFPIQLVTFPGLSIPLQQGLYWVEFHTGPTFVASDVLMAGDGLSRLAQRTINTVSEGDPLSGGPFGWGYYPDPEPQVSIRIDASSLFPIAVPEPATWTMFIGGLGLAGAALRRRRPAPTAG